MQLQEGVPQPATCVAGVRQFNILVDTARQPVDATLTVLAGAPTLSASFGTEQLAYASVNGSSVDSLFVKVDMKTLTPYAGSLPRVMRLTVGCQDEPAVFTILASQANAPIALQAGQPQAGHLSTQSGTWYEFSAPASLDASLAFSVVALGTSDPDMFVAVGRQATEADYDWTAAMWGDDLVSVHPDDPIFCAGCTYSIYVKAATGGNTNDT